MAVDGKGKVFSQRVHRPPPHRPCGTHNSASDQRKHLHLPSQRDHQSVLHTPQSGLFAQLSSHVTQPALRGDFRPDGSCDASCCEASDAWAVAAAFIPVALGLTFRRRRGQGDQHGTRAEPAFQGPIRPIMILRAFFQAVDNSCPFYGIH